MAKATTAKAPEMRLVTVLCSGDDADALVKGLDDDVQVLHDLSIDLDEPDISGSGNSYKAAFASLGGTDAPQATVRIDGKIVKVPMTVAVNAYFSKKAVDKARARG